MSSQEKQPDILQGLTRLFRFDTMSANWRSVIASFDPITASLLLAAAPIVVPLVAQKLKEFGVLPENEVVQAGLEAVAAADQRGKYAFSF